MFSFILNSSKIVNNALNWLILELPSSKGEVIFRPLFNKQKIEMAKQL